MEKQKKLSKLDHVDVTTLDQRLKKCRIIKKSSLVQLVKCPLSGQHFSIHILEGTVHVTFHPNEYFAHIFFDRFQ